MSERVTIRLGGEDVDITKLDLKNGNLFAVRYGAGSHSFRLDMMNLAQAIKKRGFDNVFILCMPGDITIEVIDDKTMEAHGWVRRPT